MRLLVWTMIGITGVNLAQAQLRLPGVPLPALPQPVQALGQTADNSLAGLSDLRHLQISRLLRANPHTIIADAHGNPIVRDELLAFSPSEAAMSGALGLGFRVVREQNIPELDVHLVVLQPPEGQGLVKALRRLREADPNGTYDFNHIYLSTGSSPAATATPTPVNAGAATASATAAGAVSRIGLVDSGIDLSHPVFRDTQIHAWGCADHPVASAHGTAVASLLVGPGSAELYAADVYCGQPTGGAVDALAAAFAWLAQQRVAVINVSLVGPDNVTLALLVRALTSRGYLLVAAVGNDGPAAPPLYPASYPGVVGVTAVDAHRRVLIEAARGKQVMFAARGADMVAADSGGKYSAVRGTSFAAPIVAALLAQGLAVPEPQAGETAVQELARHAIDLGPPGRDLTYGYGLVGEGLVAARGEKN
jgi:subtilisin family serine protease